MDWQTVVVSAVVGAVAKEIAAPLVGRARAAMKLPEGAKPWLTRRGFRVIFDLLVLVGIFCFAAWQFGSNSSAPATRGDVAMCFLLAIWFVFALVTLFASALRFGLKDSIDKLFQRIESKL